MRPIHQFAIGAVAVAVGTAVIADAPAQLEAKAPAAPTNIVSQLAAHVIAESIPREYERKKDWGRTTHVTTGLRSSGNFFKFDIHRRKSEVEHGVWKHYRVTLVEPEKNLVVRVENLRSTGANRAAFTLFVTAKLQGWARAKVYSNGVHVIAVEAEGDTTVNLWIDAEMAIERVKSDSLLPSYAVNPVVTDARFKFENFRLTRISDLKGSLVRELGEELAGMIEDELSGPKLVEKLNHSIDKRRDQLRLKPEMLLGSFSSADVGTATSHK